VDLDEKVLRIVGSMTYTKGGSLSIAEPKTEGSRRSVALTALGIDALRAHRRRQYAARLALGPAWDDTYDLVFCNEIGGPIDGRTLLRGSFYPLLDRAGLPRVRFHDLRHSAATFLVSLGIPLTIVADILGHSSTRVTGDVYTHVSVEMQRAAADALDALLRPRFRLSGGGQ
jgi:integrase